jgi:hypothetical protein
VPPIRRRRPTPRRRKAPRWTAEEWEAATGRLLRRAGFRCERCGRGVTADTCDRHHRQRREVGGDRFPNLLLLCGSGTTGCHGWVHANPAEARALGMIVSSADEVDPAEVPVRRYGGYLWLLDDLGHAKPQP